MILVFGAESVFSGQRRMPGVRARAGARGFRSALALRFLRIERDDLHLGHRRRHRRRYSLGHRRGRHRRGHMPAVGERAGTDGLRLAVVVLSSLPCRRLRALRDLFPLLSLPLSSGLSPSLSAIFGFGTGNGSSLAAAARSTSRGTSMEKRPRCLMRPAMRPASSPAPR